MLQDAASLDAALAGGAQAIAAPQTVGYAC
jgi:hypothetical protein